MVVAPRAWISAAARANTASPSRRRRSASGCSRISSRNLEPGSTGLAGSGSSTDDTRAPFDEHSFDRQVVAHDHHVRGEPDADPSEGGKPQHASRNLRRRPDGVFERYAEG